MKGKEYKVRYVGRIWEELGKGKRIKIYFMENITVKKERKYMFFMHITT